MKKKELKLAKTMLRASLSNNQMDNQKAQRVLETVVKNRPQGLSSILKLYKRLVTSQLNLENLIIETGAKIKNAKSLEKNLIAKTGARKVTYKTNPEMVFGARVMQGDWIWEENLSSKLKQLITNNE